MIANYQISARALRCLADARSLTSAWLLGLSGALKKAARAHWASLGRKLSVRACLASRGRSNLAARARLGFAGAIGWAARTRLGLLGRS